MRSRDYGSTVIITNTEIRDIREAQWDIRYYGYQRELKESLISALSAVAGVLSFMFFLPTAFTLGSAVISLITSVSGGEKDAIISACRAGEDYLQELEIMMREHPEWQAVKVRLPFMEFLDYGYRMVSGRGAIEAIKVNGGWLPA